MGMALIVFVRASMASLIARDDAAQRAADDAALPAASEQSKSRRRRPATGLLLPLSRHGEGRRAWQCELSSIDTAILIAGVLAAASIRPPRRRREPKSARSPASLTNASTGPGCSLAATPLPRLATSKGFLPFRRRLRRGPDPLHAGPRLADASDRAASLRGLCNYLPVEGIYGIGFLYAGPLFIHQMSHIWWTFAASATATCATDCDYFEKNSHRATTLIQQQYAFGTRLVRVLNDRCWGITQATGPGDQSKVIDACTHLHDYIARGFLTVPTMARSHRGRRRIDSFAPEQSRPATIAPTKQLHINAPNPYGLRRRSTRFGGDADEVGWVSPTTSASTKGPRSS